MSTSQLVQRYREQWQDEGDGAFVYAQLAVLEFDGPRRQLLLRLADVERQHQVQYARLLTEAGRPPGLHRPSAGARILVWLAHHGGRDLVLQRRMGEEASEVRAYLKGRSALQEGHRGELAHSVAADEAGHVKLLHQMGGPAGEPWHRVASGGILRNVVYGFNDGLTANFGLAMGVLGAQVAPPIVVLSGLAGLVADALSMGSSGYLAAVSEAEVHAHELELEREEMRLMPALEREELALLYEAKGVPTDLALEMARQIMAEPESALEEKATQELGIVPPVSSPLNEGHLTGASTALGAFVPVLPLLFGTGPAQVWTSFGLSMLSHFAVGAVRSLFTGR